MSDSSIPAPAVQEPVPAVGTVPAADSAPAIPSDGTSGNIPALPAEPAARPATGAGEVQEAAPRPAPEKGGPWGVLFDVLLVLLLLGVLGFGGYYIATQNAKYRIPGAMEQAMQKNEESVAKVAALKADYVEARNLLSLQREYESLLGQLREQQIELDKQKKKCAAYISAGNDISERIAQLERDILTTDADQREHALGLIQGLEVKVLRRTGRKVRDFKNGAITYRSDRKSILFRSTDPDNTGAYNIPVKELDKNSVPGLLRYGLGWEDLVNTSDFSIEAAAKRNKKSDQKSRDKDTRKASNKKGDTKKGRKNRTETNYGVSGSGPVLDSDTDEASGL